MSVHPLRQDQARARRRQDSRLRIAAALAALVLLGLFARIVYLQIVQYEHYRTLSRENRIQVRPLAPSRGFILDRNGEVLARNASVFSLEMIPEQVGDLEQMLARLRDILALSEEQESAFRQELKRRARFERVVLKPRLDEEEVAVFSVNRHRFPGVDIQARWVREYPGGEALAHLVGYVGRIDADEKRRLARDSNYRATRYIGKTGVERFRERELHGWIGSEQVEVDARGRAVRVIETTPARAGADVHLGIDAGLQRAAYAELAGESGAIVALDPRDGTVLALVSAPSFDPNLLLSGLDAGGYARLGNDPRRPLFNRALHGQYPPGSTIKMFLAFAGLGEELGLASGRIWCSGEFRLEGSSHVYRDWRKGGHGQVDLKRAITESCDVYFYRLALDLGIARMRRYLNAFGFGERTGVDLMGEKTGLVPSREWKQATKGEPWVPGETVIAGIGQGYMLATPLQLAAGTATLARRGIRVRPRVVARIARDGVERETPVEHPAPVAARHEGDWERIVGAMEETVHGRRGTARRIAPGLAYRVAGKTGTVQVVQQATRTPPGGYRMIPRERRDHALFVAFAPVGDPRIALAVVVEHGGSGGEVAAPIARRLLDHYLGGENGREKSDELVRGLARAGEGEVQLPPGGDGALP